MDSEAFVRWALDNARTLEERYTTELVVEMGVDRWRHRQKIYVRRSVDEFIERKRQRTLNPAYEPRYSEESLRRTAEVIPEIKHWWGCGGYDDRPVRDLQVFKFLPALEHFSLHSSQVADLSPLTELPNLRVLHFGSGTCEDFRPLARCGRLTELTLGLQKHWPDVMGLEKLTQLESLSLKGNLLAFEHGICWPNVRRASLECEPLDARSVRDLPQLPACEFLTLEGVERLDGIEAWSRLRNLKLMSGVRDFAPLASLPELTCFTCTADEPSDVSALVRAPKLAFVSFDIRPKYRPLPIAPRDLSPLTQSPTLRELHVNGCPPIVSEAAAINAGLPSWGDLLLADKPRPLPPTLRMAIAPGNQHPRYSAPAREPGEPELPDDGLCNCHGAWIGNYVTRFVSKHLGHSDWGSAGACAKTRCIHATITSYGVVERFVEILDAIRGAMTRLHHEYHAQVMVCLKVPTVQPTPAQIEMERKFRDAQDEAEFQQHQRDRQEYLDRLHRYELKKQEGMPINPEEFAPSDAAPLPKPPWECDEDEDDAGGEGGGDVAVKKKPDPPPGWDDDEHPLADEYRIMANFTLNEVWFLPHHRDLAIYLMRRQPDVEIPDEEKGS